MPRGSHRPSISYPPTKSLPVRRRTFDFAVERFEVAPGETGSALQRGPGGRRRHAGRRTAQAGSLPRHRYLRRTGQQGVADLQRAARELGGMPCHPPGHRSGRSPDGRPRPHAAAAASTTTCATSPAAIDNGVTFNPAPSPPCLIRRDGEYHGLRLAMNATLSRARRTVLRLKLRRPRHPRPRRPSNTPTTDGNLTLYGYPIATVIAETLHRHRPRLTYTAPLRSTMHGRLCTSAPRQQAAPVCLAHVGISEAVPRIQIRALLRRDQSRHCVPPDCGRGYHHHARRPAIPLPAMDYTVV